MEKRWIFISVLMHAVLLAGISLASRPVLKPDSVIIEVSLVSSPAGDLAGDEDFALTLPGDAGFAPVTGEPSVRVEASTMAEPKPEPGAGQIVKADPEPAAFPVDGKQPDKTVDHDVFYEDPELQTVPVWDVEAERKVEDRIHYAGISYETFDENISEGISEGVSPVHADGQVTKRQTSNIEHQTMLLAFTGNPSSLGGIMSSGKGEGDGAGTGTGPGSGTRAGAGQARPRIVSMPEPVYPVLSRRLGEQGRVVLKVKIGAEGGVLRAEVLDSSSHERLDRSALRAVKDATFKPAVINGRPVTSERMVAYVFRLEEE